MAGQTAVLAVLLALAIRPGMAAGRVPCQKRLFAAAARVLAAVLERGCGRLEWWCLDWNKPSISFYLKLGAEPMFDWTTCRISGETLHKLAEQA